MEAKRMSTAADVFADALERAPEERPAFFRHACAGDPEMLAEVESLLRAHVCLLAHERDGTPE